ncbi:MULTISPECIES: MFS transporter [Saccharothrix]|uniref:MFS transporter n=1 Tax=Saccharothrix TaxID=2071 RepID=UPI000938A22E|nr:MFS transporter [Saccharothrix sp. CB00851]OKI22290.1 MFS transporter [Saccharothrix sp. CB00851]
MQVREVLDVYGRRYRIGESDRELLGRPRSRIAWLSGIAMLVTGTAQYGFGALVPALGQRWGLVELCWAFALWTAFQAGIAFPAAWLRERGLLPPRHAVVLGAVLSAIGLLTLGSADHLLVVYLGYSLVGGIGTGLVYATCVGTVIRWFPDRVTGRIALVTGAFALGGVPFALAAGLWFDPGERAGFLSVAALVVLVVVTACGLPLRDPPRNWWPVDVDPRHRERRTHRSNRPAIRHFGPGEALRSGVLVPMYVTVVFAAAVSLFDLVFLAVFADGTVFAAVALAVLAASAGAGRILAGRISEAIGRRLTLRLAMATGGLAQLVLLFGGQRQDAVALLVGAGVAGLGTSCCYSLLVGLVREYFGEDTAPLNFAVIYSAKALGGVLGVGLASLVVVSHGYPGPFLAAAVLGVAGAALGGRFSRPGRPHHLLPRPREAS